MNTSPLFFGILDHATAKVPFTIYYAPAPASPDQAFMAIANYRSKRFAILGPDADDCRLGLHLLLQNYDAKTPANAKAEPGTTVH